MNRLENINKNKVFTVYDMIDERITSLIARMYDYMEVNTEGAQKAVLQSWRSDLTVIRAAIEKLAEEENGNSGGK